MKSLYILDALIFLTIIITLSISIIAAKEHYSMGPPIKENIDHELEPYLKRFKSHAEKYCADNVLFTLKYNIIYKFTEQIECYLEDGETICPVGLCTPFGNINVITLSLSHWKRYSILSRENLLFHELGHCAMYRDHENKTNALGFPKSIMYYSVFYDKWYEQYQEEYIEELFNPEGLRKEVYCCKDHHCPEN